MTGVILFVDLENCPRPAWAKIPRDALVKIFIGAGVPKDVMKLAKRFRGLEARNQQYRVVTGRKNALDFHIAYYLGQTVLEAPRATMVILSKDKGLDALLQYMRNSGVRCCRVSDLTHVEGIQKLHQDPLGGELWWVVQNMNGPSRPKSRRRLRNHVATYFGHRADAREVDIATDLLFAAGTVSETGSRLAYSF